MPKLNHIYYKAHARLGKGRISRPRHAVHVQTCIENRNVIEPTSLVNVPGTFYNSPLHILSYLVVHPYIESNACSGNILALFHILEEYRKTEVLISTSH